MFVRNLFEVGLSKIQFWPFPKLKELEIDVEVIDVLQYFTKVETLTMDSKFMPWEKSTRKGSPILEDVDRSINTFQ